MPTTASPAPTRLFDELSDRARAAVGSTEPTRYYLSTEPLAARAGRLVGRVRHLAGKLVADARTAVGAAATSASTNTEHLVAARLAPRIRAKVVTAITAALLVALLALLLALVALYRLRGRA